MLIIRLIQLFDYPMQRYAHSPKELIPGFRKILPLSDIYYPLYLNTLTILSPDFLLQSYASAILHEVQRQGLTRT